MNETFSYDTSSIPARSRFGYWHELVCDLYCPSENAVDPDLKDFRATVTGNPLGQLILSQTRSSPFVSTRSEQSLRRKPMDSFFILMLKEGEASLRQNGRCVKQRKGDIAIYDSSRPFVYELPTNYEAVVVNLPRDLAGLHMANIDSLAARSITAASSLGQLVGRVLSEAVHLDIEQDTPSAHRVAMTIVDLLAAGFEADTNSVQPEDKHRASQQDMARSYILANLEDPDLDMEAVANALSISRRTLNRLFAEAGTTPSRWLWQQRLVRAKAIFESGSKYRVSEVALRLGFKDISHFCRAFKSQYGSTPNSIINSDQ